MVGLAIRRFGLLGFVLTTLWTASPRAQALRRLTGNTQEQPATGLSMCGQAMPRLPSSIPQAIPPSPSGPVVYLISLCFEPESSQSRFPPEHYLGDIRLKPSRPSQGLWIPYDAAVEKVIFEDYQRIWNNNALDNLSIELRDYLFSNGVIGKVVTYNITERN
jgi:hypothetical protein